MFLVWILVAVVVLGGLLILEKGVSNLDYHWIEQQGIQDNEGWKKNVSKFSISVNSGK